MKPYYQHAGITIYHGDCREVLPSQIFDCLLTDPPYGINHNSGFESTWSGIPIVGDENTAERDWVLQYIAERSLRLPIFVFGSWKVMRPERTRQVLIWNKGPASGMGDLSFPWKNSFEEIYILGDGFSGSRDEGVLQGHNMVTWESGPGMDGSNGRLHPNQKPLSLCKYLLSKTSSKFILDPFMGSGTTLRAAKDLGRRAIGIEIEEKYCEIAAKRLSQEVFEFKP